ncbi:hypothetical protein FRB95_012905 [Tulasnella sp. JGI-2019a]|nr:hypothetical protein FRB95_012905 [Tulasnella sp. JGI-2019a]
MFSIILTLAIPEVAQNMALKEKTTTGFRFGLSSPPYSPCKYLQTILLVPVLDTPCVKPLTGRGSLLTTGDIKIADVLYSEGIFQLLLYSLISLVVS